MKTWQYLIIINDIYLFYIKIYQILNNKQNFNEKKKKNQMFLLLKCNSDFFLINTNINQRG